MIQATRTARACTGNWMVLKVKLDERSFLTVCSNELSQQYRWGAVSRTYLHCNSGEWEIDVWPPSYVRTREAESVTAN